MKMRQGFVSNSSSASFVIIKDKLTEYQFKMLLLYSHKDNKNNIDGWDICEQEEFVKGNTIMDNGGIYSFIEELEISNDIMVWSD